MDESSGPSPQKRDIAGQESERRCDYGSRNWRDAFEDGGRGHHSK